MKKFLSMLLALCMACMLVPAFAEEAQSAAPITVEIALDVNGDALTSLMGGAQNDSVTAVAKLLSSLSARMTQAGANTEIVLSLQDQPVLSFAMIQDEKGVQILSDLFPSYVVTFGAEDIQQALSGQANGLADLQNLDLSSALEAAAPVLTEFTAGLEDKIGAPEAAEYEYEGTVFTTRTPVNITVKEVNLLVLKLAKAITEDAKVAEYLSKIPGLQITGIDEAIERISSADEASLGEAVMGLYSNEAGNMLFDAEVKLNDQTEKVIFASIAPQAIVDITSSNQGSLHMTVNQETQEIRADFKTVSNGQNVSLELYGAPGEAGRYDAEVTISINDVKLLGVGLGVSHDGTLTADFSTEGKTAVNALSLNSTEDSEEKNGLLAEVMSTGLMGLLQKVSTAMPEEAAALMSLFMTPSAQ